LPWLERTVLEYAGLLIIRFTYCLGFSLTFFLFYVSDLRLGQQAKTVAMDFEKVFPVSDKLYIGLTGLATDVLSVNQLLNFRCNLYKLRENREMSAPAFSAMLSSLLYEKRYKPCFCC
jgi:20S proteasome subunit beta 3